MLIGYVSSRFTVGTNEYTPTSIHVGAVCFCILVNDVSFNLKYALRNFSFVIEERLIKVVAFD